MEAIVVFGLLAAAGVVMAFAPALGRALRRRRFRRDRIYRMRKIRESLEDMNRTLGEGLVPAFRKAGEAISALGVAMSQPSEDRSSSEG